MSTCYQGITTPNTLPTKPCNGCYTNDVCVIHAPAIPYLNLPVNSSVGDIITNLVLANVAKDQLIADLAARITILENA